MAANFASAYERVLELDPRDWRKRREVEVERNVQCYASQYLVLQRSSGHHQMAVKHAQSYI